MLHIVCSHYRYSFIFTTGMYTDNQHTICKTTLITLIIALSVERQRDAIGYSAVKNQKNR